MTLKHKRILITGVSGFAGSHLARHLLNEGSNVLGMLRRRADGRPPHNLMCLGIHNELELLEADICDISSLAFALDRARPEIIFHLAAQSFVPRSFSHPRETTATNCLGTVNLLEAVRAKDLAPTIVFAGSSEEYGLVLVSEHQHQEAVTRYGTVFPEPEGLPEVPITETNPLRPMSSYAVSKVFGDYIMRNYHHSYGMNTIVSRAFNHEGPGRGKMFVTSVIASQVMQLKRGEIGHITIGNVNAFRDWSHVDDVVKGYCMLALRGKPGDVYNQGSQRTNSVLSYLLLALESAGYAVNRIETLTGDKKVDAPAEVEDSEAFGVRFPLTRVDRLMLGGELDFHPSDRGLRISADRGDVIVQFAADRFRPAEVPILLSCTAKIGELGFKAEHSLKSIINDQLNYYLDPAKCV